MTAPQHSDDLQALRSLVDRQVVPLIRWYQRKKRWPRRLHKSTSAAVIILGASIPVATAWSASNGTRLIVGVVGVLIATLGSLAASYDWQKRWRIFTIAQQTLESKVAEWELAITKAQLSSTPEQARAAAIAATEKLLDAAAQARDEETVAFFGSSAERPPAVDARPVT